MVKVIDKQPDEGAPSELDMHEHDARHAVMADPERYEMVPKTAAQARAERRARMSLADRVAALEVLFDRITAADEVVDETAPAPAPVDQGTA